MYGMDLFSGIGGITKALEGYVQPVAYCDNEPYARSVLLSRMHTEDLPAAPIWDDVRTLRGAMLPHVDIIYGGFPCQDISVAGKQIGLGGERSGLFFEIMRLARETGAEWIFLENVPNIRTKGLGQVLQTLADSGYDCRWGALSAADVGANHKRNRWFLLAHANNKGLEGRNSRELQERFGEQSPRTSGPLADSFCSRLERYVQSEVKLTQLHRESAGFWETEPNVGRVANGIPKRVDRLRALGNAVIPAQAREAFERLMGIKGA